MRKIAHPDVYEALEIVMQYYPDKFSDQARAEVEILLDHCLSNLEESSEKFLTTLFIKALKQYIGPVSVDEHIYLKKYSLPQIQLFDILIKKFPFVKYGHEIANNLFFDKLKNEQKAIFVDIGIGRGIQTVALLDQLKDSKLEKLEIIGIEPFEDAIKVAKEIIEEKAKEVPFKVEFVEVHGLIEDTDFGLIEALVTPQKKLFINSSLTLHHIKRKTDREIILRKLQELKPEMFLLTEPNVNHYERNFYKRFQNCFQHFYHVFKVIDKLDIDNNAKSSLKLFFGREIEDIIGKKEEDRYERHDLAKNWIEILETVNFEIDRNFEFRCQGNQAGVNISHREDGFLGFSFEEEIVLSIINART